MSAEYGQFGDELATKAESLCGAVQEWMRQGAERLSQRRESGAPTDARPAPAEAMTKEAEPNAAVKAARMRAGSGADAEQQSGLSGRGRHAGR